MILLLLSSLTAEARTASFSILFSGDVEGSLGSRRHPVHGMSGISRCIAAERARGASLFLADCGNFASGSWDSALLRSTPMYGMLDSMHYDVWVPGWRDWRNGASLLNQPPCSVPILAANVCLQQEASPPCSYLLRTLDGVRVAVIGMTSPNTPLCYPSGSLDGMIFQDVVDALGGIMPEVREASPDVVLLILNAGPFSRQAGPGWAVRIARMFPEVNLLLTGGERASRRIGTLYYAAPLLNASHLGRVDVRYDTVKSCITAVDCETLDLGDDSAKPGKQDGVPGDVWKRWNQMLEEPVGVLTQALTGTSGESGETEAGRFMAQAVMSALQADAVFFRWPVGSSLSAGPVCVRDVTEAFPDYTEWGVLLLTPEEMTRLWDDVEKNRGTDRALGFMGLHFRTIETDEEKERVSVTADDGSALHPRKRYRIAVPLEVMASAGGVYPSFRILAENPLTQRSDSTVDILAAVRNYMQTNPGGDASHE